MYGSSGGIFSYPNSLVIVLLLLKLVPEEKEEPLKKWVFMIL
jgi:hypothetical protein